MAQGAKLFLPLYSLFQQGNILVKKNKPEGAKMWQKDVINMAANRILVVEDDRGILDAVSLNLRYVGYDYKSFDDGAEAADYLGVWVHR